jgi:hypothetical protein
LFTPTDFNNFYKYDWKQHNLQPPMRTIALLVSMLSYASASCPDGTFYATYSRTSCSLWNAGIKSKYTAASTRGEIVSLSTAANSACELLIAPNVSLGTATQFTVKVNSINLDASSSMGLFSCTSADVCELAHNVVSASTFIVPMTAMMKIVFQAGSATPTTYASNTFLISWDSGLTLPCLACTNLVPTPAGSANWLYNNAPGIGCDWKCAPGYYVPTTGMTADNMGGFVTTGTVGCVPCTLCNAGTFTNPAQYDGGCWAYVSNGGTYGAVINSKNSNCKQCSTCAPAVSQACSQLSDTVCSTSVRAVAKPVVGFK